MDEAKRDELLIRIDERLKAVKSQFEENVPEIKHHLQSLNGAVQENRRRITRNEVILYFALGGSGTAAGIAKLLGLY